MKNPKDTFTLDTEQGDALIERLKKKAITQDDDSMLSNITRCYFWLMRSLQEAKISMSRFKAMLFGGKKSNGKGQDQGQDAAPSNSDPTTGVAEGPATETENKTPRDGLNSDEPCSDDASDPKNDNQPAKGHGRLGADAYTGATDMVCTPQTYTTGMPCPQGNVKWGTLHHYPSGVPITINGSAPLQATR